MDGIFKDMTLEDLAREVARMEGTSPADAVRRALLDRKAVLEDIDRRRAQAHAILREIQQTKPISDKSVDELLYDEYGLPK